jgi:beta-1,4-mannosyltransferase
MRAVVVAPADLGRNARMLYHARALADAEVDVDLVGLEGTPLPRRIADHPRIAVHRIRPPAFRPSEETGVRYALLATLSALRFSARLWRVLRKLRHPALVLVQNPPAIPTLTVTRFALKNRTVRFVIDWHNISYTLLRRRLGRWHPAVRLARWIERREARRVDAHLSVSRGMAAFLTNTFGLPDVRVLYDRPAAAFVAMQGPERERFRQALFGRLGVRSGPCGFIICPSSWTEDEDFDVVVDAVVRLEERIRGWEATDPGRRFPQLIVLITGDGARRVAFERRFAGLPSRRVHLRARWLEPEEYPQVVGSADLGLCLHRSSSGLDIPIKIADLFGAGVPVCALDYGACLAERVRHAENGLLFSTARQLADVIFDLFERYPADQTVLERLRAGARKLSRPTWEEGWNREAKPILLPDLVTVPARVRAVP